MPEPVAEPALNGLRLNLRIVSIVMFNFASYLTIGLPLAVLPGYVHDAMGFSAFWAGLIISLQYFATLLSRPHAGRYADVLGPKKIVVFGLCGCFLSGLGYLLADIASAWPMISLLLLGLGRVILGIGQSFAGTGSTLWGVGVVGSLHIGRVISWNGIVTYGAMAMGAPLGVLCYAWGGLQGLALTVMGVALLAVLLALPRPSVKANKGKPLPFRAVLGVSGCMVWRWRWPRQGLASSRRLLPYFMMLKAGMAPLLRSRYLASRLSARVCCSLTASIV